MHKYKINVAAILLIGLLVVGCSTSHKKRFQEKESNSLRIKNLEDENKNYKLEMEEFRKTKSEEIASNEKSLVAFKLRVSTLKKEEKKKFEKKISKLNNKNSDLKKKIADFKTDNKTNWENFKYHFNHDMKKLGNAIKFFRIKNE